MKTNLTLLSNFKKIRKLLANKKRWTKGCCARDKQGNQVRINSPDAASYCLIGAICKVVLLDEQITLLNFSKEKLGRSITGWNDAKHRTHKQVIAFLDKIITRLKKEKKNE